MVLANTGSGVSRTVPNAATTPNSSVTTPAATQVNLE